MTKAEAGKLGIAAVQQKLQQQKADRHAAYAKNPKRCLYCEQPITFEKRLRYRFCNGRCSARYNNKKNTKTCLHCKQTFTHGEFDLKYCSRKCAYNSKNDNFNKKFQKGLIVNPSSIHMRLVRLRGHRCEKCKLETWMGQPVPLDQHHINGNWKSNKPENIQLLCKNCHALTPEYGGRNRGKGRTHRYKDSV